MIYKKIVFLLQNFMLNSMLLAVCVQLFVKFTSREKSFNFFFAFWSAKFENCSMIIEADNLKWTE